MEKILQDLQLITGPVINGFGICYMLNECVCVCGCVCVCVCVSVCVGVCVWRGGWSGCGCVIVGAVLVSVIC